MKGITCESYDAGGLYLREVRSSTYVLQLLAVRFRFWILISNCSLLNIFVLCGVCALPAVRARDVSPRTKNFTIAARASDRPLEFQDFGIRLDYY